MDSSRARVKRGAVVWCLAFVGAAAGLHAQRPTGEIRLAVKDPSGAAMEASGRLRNLATGAERAFKTDARGMFAFQSLLYGRYRLEVSKDGFATQSAVIDL